MEPSEQHAARNSNWVKVELLEMEKKLSTIIWNAVLSDYEQEVLLRILERLESFTKRKYIKRKP